MSKLLLMSLALGVALAYTAGWGEAYSNSETNRPLITGGVTYEHEVPDEIYGTWQRTRTLISSSFPDTFQRVETGYWTITQKQDRITLANPETGASTTIHLTSVNGNTAVFHYDSHLGDGTPCHEELTLTPTATTLDGLQKKVCTTPQQQAYVAIAKVSGQRLDNGPPVGIFH